MSKFINDKPLEHMCRNGTVFKSERCDLKSGVRVYSSWELDKLQLAADFAEFGAWHAVNYWNQLNGFSGYDNIIYKLNP